MIRAAWVAVLVTSAALASQAQNSGTEPGQSLPGPFNAFVVWPKGPPPAEGQTEERQNQSDPTRAGKFHDLVTRYGLDPTVAVFLSKVPAGADDPAAKLLKSLDETVSKNRDRRLHGFAIFRLLKKKFLLDDERIPQIRALEQLGNKLAIKEMPLALTELTTQQSTNYKLPDLSDDANRDLDQVTVIVYESHKVRAKISFDKQKPLNDAGVQAVLAEVNRVIKK